jgi:serine/threonine protein kinase
VSIDKKHWEALSPLLDELLEADEAIRAARLAQIRQQDVALADELVALLAPQAAIKRVEFLESTALPTIEPTLAGQQIGNYTLDRPLGHGGMGMVWLAHRSDGRYEGWVAIKFLSLALFGPQGIDRFKREGTVLARLTHPNIARLSDAGVTPLGQPYLVLEYIEGEPIDRWCDSRALDITARIHLFQQVIAAVEHAHGKLILHRDLKPSNILVTRDGQVKLLDFGIAKLLDDGQSTRAITELTQMAGRAFSPDFAAPEQVQGEEVTTATDVYSLGVLLHMLLTEQHPTSRSTHTPVEKLRAIIETEPTRPSDIVAQPSLAVGEMVNLRQRARTLRGDLDNILLKALRKSPADRYPGVGALAEDLQRFLNDEPVSARADSVPYQISKFVRRHRVGVITAAGVLTASVLATAITTEQMLEARRQRDEAQRQRDEAQYQSQRAESVSNFLDLLLRSDGGPDRPALTLSERIDAGVNMLETQYRRDPRFAGRMLIHLSEGLLIRSGDNQRVIPLLQRAYELGKQSGDKELMASAQCHIAQNRAEASVMEEAEKHMAEAQGLLAQVDQPELNTRMECLLARARLAEGQGNLETALALLESAIPSVEAAGNTHHPMYTAILTHLAAIHVQLNQIPAALQLNERAVDAHERYGRGDTADSVAAQQNTAAMLLLAGEAGEALARRELINRRVREFEPEGRVPLAYIYNQSVLLLRMAHLDAAKASLEPVLDRARQAKNPAMLTQFLLAAGLLYIELGQWTQADAVLAEAAQLVDGGVAPNCRWVASTCSRRASTSRRRSKLWAMVRTSRSAFYRRHWSSPPTLP